LRIYYNRGLREQNWIACFASDVQARIALLSHTEAGSPLWLMQWLAAATLQRGAAKPGTELRPPRR